MEQVNASECHLAMIPIENSVAGRVADIHYLLGGYDLKIYSEHFQEINHQLMVKPGASLDTIKNVRSHSMAIGQCHAAIKKYNLDVIIMADTAGSAKFISEQGTMEDSAIASTLAADTYGLDIVDTNIQDMKNNTTRFLIMSKELQQERNENLSYLTSCIFEVKSVPSALYKALGGFATNGVNLTKLESFIVDGDFNKAQFYIDLDGHAEDQSVKGALEELSFYTEKLKVLGVYPKHSYRNN
jgi:prephenate dehydratase